jgi:hypothetical protein
LTNALQHGEIVGRSERDDILPAGIGRLQVEHDSTVDHRLFAALVEGGLPMIDQEGRTGFDGFPCAIATLASSGPKLVHQLVPVILPRILTTRPQSHGPDQ